MSDMRMYNILGVMKGLNDNAKTEQLNESVKQPTVYENVEPKGSIMDAVKSLAGKFAKFNESAKPDFLDVDKDGNKKEPMKQAVKEKKAEPFSSDDYDEYGVRHSSSFNQPPKKAVKDKNNAKGAFNDMFGGDANDLTSKLKIKEGAGPYTLDDPKHPKFKANYEKFKKSNPDCKLADFVAAMKKKEKAVNEAYDEPEAPNADAVAKRKRLQAIKDRQEDERAMGSKDDTNTPIRKVAGKAYGGAAQAVEKDDELEEDSINELVRIDPNHRAGGNFKDQAERDSAAAQAAGVRKNKRSFWGDKQPGQDAAMRKADIQGAASASNQQTQAGRIGVATATKYNDNFTKKWVARPGDDGKGVVGEVAPPGAKAERMVKHVKKGYAKDGNLSKREKGIAYATAWKAHNKGQVEEGVAFGDTVKNSTPSWKKAKPMKLKESRMLQEGDYFYESIAKALCDKNPNLDTAGNEFVTAVRQEMVAQGITPNKARNILLMDEDFLSDVATSYGHYCKEVAESSNFFHNPNVPDHEQLPAPPEEVNVELDEIARLAGLAPKMETTMGAVAGGVAGAALGKTPAAASMGAQIGDQLTGESCNMEELDEASSRKDFRMVADLLANITDPAKRAELAKHHAEIFKQQNPRFSYDKFYAAAGVNPDDALLPNPPAEITIEEEDMAEGNEFSGALAAAKASGAKEFEVDGKKYTVKEDINVNITANGQEDALNLFRKLAGMDEVETQPAIRAISPVIDAGSAIAQGIIEPVDEERDIEYANTPNEKIGPVSAAIPSGTGEDRAKKMYRKEYPGDNPMAVKEDTLWKKYSGMLKGLIK
jgi:hypothetical protein